MWRRLVLLIMVLYTGVNLTRTKSTGVRSAEDREVRQNITRVEVVGEVEGVDKGMGMVPLGVELGFKAVTKFLITSFYNPYQ